MLGAGIFNIPQSLANVANSKGVLLGWIFTVLGIGFVVLCFSMLEKLKPEIKNGLHSYIEDGFGVFTAFLTTFGYWISNCFALAAFALVSVQIIDFFFPYFNDGHNFNALLLGSFFIWLVFFINKKGLKHTVFLNNIGTIAKVIGIIIIVLLFLNSFSSTKFLYDFDVIKNSSTIFNQAKSTMLLLFWLFLGIEGSIVVSDNADSKDVRKALLISFVIISLIYLLIALLPYGIYSRNTLSKLSEPSIGIILFNKYGYIGQALINILVFISIISSWLVWLVMVAELPAIASKSKSFPKIFNHQDQNGTYDHSLLINCIIIQLIFLFTYNHQQAWDLLICVTGVMALPVYLFSALYLVKIGINTKNIKAIIVGVIASIFALFTIYSSGLNYLLISLLIYILGLPIYFYSKKAD